MLEFEELIEWTFISTLGYNGSNKEENICYSARALNTNKMLDKIVRILWSDTINNGDIHWISLYESKIWKISANPAENI